MKLPTDKKDRQMLILIAIVAISAVYAVINFMVMPLIRVKQEMPLQLEEINTKISQAQLSLSSVPENLARHNAAVDHIGYVASEYLLQPVLGSYILEAERLIEQQAQVNGVVISSYREDGIRDIPKPRRRQPGNRLRSYSIIVHTRIGYDKLISLIDAIEQSNPYVAILDLHVAANPQTPLEHDVRFRVQWPIWGGIDELPLLRTQ